MRPDSPALTLCITANHARYLSECLISVAAQLDVPYKLVLCADSTGEAGVVDIFEKFLPFLDAADIRIKVTEGGTAGATRNAAFEAADTEWVTYLDGDDLLMPGALRDLSQVAHTGAGDILGGGLFLIEADGSAWTVPESLDYKAPIWLYYADLRTFDHWAFVTQPLAIRRSLWQEYRFVETTNQEDVDFMLHQLLMGRYIKIPSVMYGYRHVPESFSSRKYVGGDICERRYHDGYYAQLFETLYTPGLADNFR